MGWWQVWWIWAALAGGLGVLEVMAPGYIFLGFAIGGLAMAAMSLLGVAMGMAASLLVFALASLVGYVALRLFVPGSRGNAKIWDRDINNINR